MKPFITLVAFFCYFSFHLGALPATIPTEEDCQTIDFSDFESDFGIWQDGGVDVYRGRGGRYSNGQDFQTIQEWRLGEDFENWKGS